MTKSELVRRLREIVNRGEFNDESDPTPEDLTKKLLMDIERGGYEDNIIQDNQSPEA